MYHCVDRDRAVDGVREETLEGWRKDHMRRNKSQRQAAFRPKTFIFVFVFFFQKPGNNESYKVPIERLQVSRRQKTPGVQKQLDRDVSAKKCQRTGGGLVFTRQILVHRPKKHKVHLPLVKEKKNHSPPLYRCEGTPCRHRHFTHVQLKKKK